MNWVVLATNAAKCIAWVIGVWIVAGVQVAVFAAIGARTGIKADDIEWNKHDICGRWIEWWARLGFRLGRRK